MEIEAKKQSTITVRISFMGDLLPVIGQRDLELTLPKGASVGSLLQSLSETYGEAFACRVFCGPAKLRHTMLIFVDGENISRQGGLAATLSDSAVEVIMLPMFGGG